MPLAYADDVDIIGNRDREVTVAFSMFSGEARIGLALNQSKTKYSTLHQLPMILA